MSQTELLELSFDNQVGTIRICREAQLNALNEQVLTALSATLAELRSLCVGPEAYKKCRVLLLRGSGNKAFVAGADIKEMAGHSVEETKMFAALGQKVMREIEALPLPVIAVVEGFALGGGLELALAADMIVASDKAVLGQPEVKLGLIPGFGGTQRLMTRTGIGQTKRLVFTGENINAQEAHALGLIDLLFTPEELPAGLERLCQSLIERSPLAIAAAKLAIEKHVEAQKLSGLAFEQSSFIACFQTADAKIGLDAFVNKRKPKFTGSL